MKDEGEPSEGRCGGRTLGTIGTGGQNEARWAKCRVKK